LPRSRSPRNPVMTESLSAAKRQEARASRRSSTTSAGVIARRSWRRTLIRSCRNLLESFTSRIRRVWSQRLVSLSTSASIAGGDSPLARMLTMPSKEPKRLPLRRRHRRSSIPGARVIRARRHFHRAAQASGSMPGRFEIVKSCRDPYDWEATTAVARIETRTRAAEKRFSHDRILGERNGRTSSTLLNRSSSDPSRPASHSQPWPIKWTGADTVPQLDGRASLRRTSSGIELCRSSR